MAIVAAELFFNFLTMELAHILFYQTNNILIIGLQMRENIAIDGFHNRRYSLDVQSLCLAKC